MTNRREFLKKATIASAGMFIGANAFAGKKLYIPGKANDTINIAIIGLNSRAYAHSEALLSCTNVKISHICDVDSIILEKFKANITKTFGYTPETEKDFRKLLENKDIDAITIATPEHLHAPIAIMGLQAGKHVYVEKPCSHNLFENELIVAAQKKYGKLVQMGNQQRSSVTSAKAIKEIKEGIIGDVYLAKSWYSNTRGPIGIGKKVPVPQNLDWDLWQGPAPREEYRDNIHTYNWHWFKSWGTGEIHNNGTHEIDICRWALGVDYPSEVSSLGGRYHGKDDWQFFDTQIATYKFGDNKTITWEGISCNGLKQFGKGRGSIIQGTKGSILLDREIYILYDLGGSVIKEEIEESKGNTNTADTKGFDLLTVTHMQNFLDGIRINKVLNSPINDAAISSHLCHLGNIAQFEQKSLEIDSKTGLILNDKKIVEKHWKREYQKGWEPKL